MKKLLILAGCAFAATLPAGCIDDSPYIPAGPHFLVEYNIAADGSINQGIRVDLFTGDLHQYSSVTDGGMTLNGEPMKLGHEMHAQLPYYYVESPIVEPNTTYLFEIPLADGRTATATVTTQEKGLLTLVVPPTVKDDSDVFISWSSVSNHEHMTVSVFYTPNNSNDELLAASYRLTPEDIVAGSFTIPHTTFNKPGMKNARIWLAGWKMGTATNFADGGRIMSKMTIEDIVAVD